MNSNIVYVVIENFMIKRAGKYGGIYAKPIHLSRKNRKYAVNCGSSYGEWTEPNDIYAFAGYNLARPNPKSQRHILILP